MYLCRNQLIKSDKVIYPDNFVTFYPGINQNIRASILAFLNLALEKQLLSVQMICIKKIEQSLKCLHLQTIKICKILFTKIFGKSEIFNDYEFMSEGFQSNDFS